MKKELIAELPRMSRGELLDVLGDRCCYCPRNVLERLARLAVLAVVDDAPAPCLSSYPEGGPGYWVEEKTLPLPVAVEEYDHAAKNIDQLLDTIMELAGGYNHALAILLDAYAKEREKAADAVRRAGYTSTLAFLRANFDGAK